MDNVYTITPEMKTVWNKFRKQEDPTEKELEALYNALKEKKAENAKLDILRRADDLAYSRPKCFNGLDTEGEANAFEILNEFTHEKFEKYGKGTITQLRIVYEYMG